MDVQRIVDWAKSELGQTLSPDEVERLLSGSNGDLYKKVFEVFTQQVVSKERGVKMQEAEVAHDNQAKIMQLEQRTVQLLQTSKKSNDRKSTTSHYEEEMSREFLTDLMEVLQGIIQRQNSTNLNGQQVLEELSQAVDNLEAIMSPNYVPVKLKATKSAPRSNGMMEKSSEKIAEEIMEMNENVNLLIGDLSRLLNENRQRNANHSLKSFDKAMNCMIHNAGKCNCSEGQQLTKNMEQLKIDDEHQQKINTAKEKLKSGKEKHGEEYAKINQKLEHCLKVLSEMLSKSSK